MKQFTCSMSKKKESLAKKNEANSEEYITEWQADIIKGLEKVKDKYGLVIEYNGPFSDEWKEYPTYSVFVRKGGKKEDIGTVGTDYVHAFVDYTSPGMNVSSPHYAKDYSAEEAIQAILNSAKMCLGKKGESKKFEDFDMNKAFFQAKKAITDWTKRQGHKTLEWLYTDGRKSPTSYPSGIWDFEWDTGNGMATAELKVSPYETRTNSWNDRMDFSLRVGTEDKPMFYTSVEDVLYALDTLINKTEIKMESKKNERGTTKIETYVGFDELLGYADAEYLLEDVVDVLSKYYTYEDETFDEDQAKDDPEFTIKIEGGDERADFYSEDIFYVHLPNKEAAEELANALDGELSESKKSEDVSSVDDLLARHNQKWLVKVSYDVDASHSAVAPSIVRADTKDAATNIALKRHRGLGYNMKVVSVEPMTESRKKSEGIGDFLDAKIDYNMFMRMCKTAAYLEEDEDYWDALWEYFSEVGSIGDALVFFDNLFQYTSWKTAEDLWTDYSNILGDKPEGKDYEEALDAYLDENDNEVGNAAAFKYGDHYLMIY